MSKIKIPFEKIEEAVKVDSARQTRYDDGYNREKGFVQGVKWALKYLNNKK